MRSKHVAAYFIMNITQAVVTVLLTLSQIPVSQRHAHHKVYKPVSLNVIFQAFMAAVAQMMVFFLDQHTVQHNKFRCFDGTCCLCLQGD
jgi:hypothetical protein